MTFETLPFNHDSPDFWQAINLTSDDLVLLFINPKMFNELPLAKQLRVVSCLAYIAILSFLKQDHHLSLPTLLLFKADSKHSANVEFIEKNLSSYLIEKPDRLPKIWEGVATAVLKEVDSILQHFQTTVKNTMN